jgi:hypothetical protein
VAIETGVKLQDMVEVKSEAPLQHLNCIVVKGAHNLLSMQANAEEE